MHLLKQIGVVALGGVVAAAMIALGLWQLNVYRIQGEGVAQARAAAPAVALLDVARAGGSVGDAYGRTVKASGRYDASLQLVVDAPADGQPPRLLTGLVQSDGSVVPVVRGTMSTVPTELPAPPGGEVSLTGIFLPSERAVGSGADSVELSSVQLPVIAQQWRPALVSGFLTLSPSESADQGLGAASASLPESKGRLRNGAYALQWWIFAAFALAMALKMARDLGRLDDDEVAVSEPAGTSGRAAD